MKDYSFPCILVLVIIFTLSSCTTTLYHHVSNYQAVPSYHQKKDFQINGSVGNIAILPLFVYPFCFNFNAGYAISDRFFIDVTALSDLTVQDKTEVFTKRKGFGIGYYKHNNTYFYGSKLNVLFGSYEINTNTADFGNMNFDAYNTCFSICPFLGHEEDNTQVTFQLNFSNNYFYSIDNHLSGLDFIKKYKDIKSFENINSPFSTWYLEPSVSFKYGNRVAKVVVEDIYSIQLNGKQFSFLENNIYFGVELNIPFK
jgi:hypothetical protein